MTVINPSRTIYEFNVQTPDGVSRGTMQEQPALPERGDVLELQDGQEFRYWLVRHRQFTTGGRVVVIVDPVR